MKHTVHRFVFVLVLSCIVHPFSANAQERPDTRETLIEVALAAMKDNKPDAFLTLFPTIQELGEMCPTLTDKKAKKALENLLTEQIEATSNVIAKCNEDIDWEKAKQTTVEGGEETFLMEKCDGMMSLSTIVIHVEANSKKFEVKLLEPYLVNGKTLMVMHAPECRRVRSRNR